jgi:hypothetical protein
MTGRLVLDTVGNLKREPTGSPRPAARRDWSHPPNGCPARALAQQEIGAIALLLFDEFAAATPFVPAH